MRLYLAGPLFTAAERSFNTQLRDLLVSAGHEVWLPQDREPREKTPVAIFEMDIDGMDWSDVVIANMDGPDPDSGTCWECGYAYRKKKIIVYRTDFRGAGEMGSPFNLMLSASADHVLVLPPFATVEQLAHELRGLLAQCARDAAGKPQV
jgi:nucleoside 2-deoxyribosyltransferase